ncbi:MAG: potassium transporter TrkG [Actinomycetota bacterium]
MSRLLPRNPGQAVVLGFAVAIAIGTLLLMIPAARVGPGGAPFEQALFTATSAVSVTGLTVVDTATYWSDLGQAVIAAEIVVGGFGILTSAALLVMLAGRRLGLRATLLTQAEAGALNLADVRRVVAGVAVLSLSVETVAATVLTLRFWLGEDMAFGEALWNGAFHAVSAFNNAGFALFSDSLMSFSGDAWILVTVALTIIAGSLGLPVALDLARAPRRARAWSLHTKITLAMTGALIVLGTLAMWLFEWTNDATTGDRSAGGKLLLGFFNAITPRTAGFNAIDYGDAQQETLFVTDILMFIGGGSGSTAGGVKVATIAVLTLMVISEIRGRTAVTAFERQIPGPAQRQALAVALLAIGIVVTATLALMAVSPHGLSASLFEAVSAFATVGLSTGITADLPPSGEAILIVLMFIGRVGPLTAGIALLMRERRPLYAFPEERPIVG